MTLTELIYNRLLGSKALNGKLASFNNKPAIFYQQIPGDTDSGWGESQYPRIDLTIDMQASPERQSSGQMMLDITSIDTAISPEEIEADVRAEVRDIFMTPTEGPAYCFSWNRSDAFNISSNKANQTGDIGLSGISSMFDILAFPGQETTDPDPIMAIDKFIKAWEPNATLIGKDKLPDYYSAEETRPAFYTRIVTLEKEKETNTVAWMRATIGIHIFAPTAAARLKWLKHLTDAAALAGEVIMLDGSPMFLLNIKADSAADYLMTGQLRLTVRYGILRRAISTDKLNHSNMSYKEVIRNE